jgi:transcriptional regulator with XRE-family HTH domain
MSAISLKHARERADLSQRELERRAGLTKGVVNQIESGRNKRPAHEVVTKLVRALQRSGLAGITAEEVFPVQDDEEKVA